MTSLRTGDKKLMPASAIYPKYFAAALFKVRYWLLNGADGVDIRSHAKMYADNVPSVADALDLALRDVRVHNFDDKDPGWETIDRDLPPPMDPQIRGVLLKRKRLAKETSKQPITVDDDSEDSSEWPRPHERSQVYGWGLGWASCKEHV